jgi:hypothetical protein
VTYFWKQFGLSNGYWLMQISKLVAFSKKEEHHFTEKFTLILSYDLFPCVICFCRLSDLALV